MKPIRVLIIDDSALIRKVLTRVFESSPDIEVVGTAEDPIHAREQIKKLSPDVLTLDVEMPRMDGLTFLSNLMRLRPMPVVMISTLTEKGAEVTLRALELGAVDFIAKPKLDASNGLNSYADDIITKVKAASVSQVKPLNNHRNSGKSAPAGIRTQPTKSVIASNVPSRRTSTTDKLIALGASTGGTEAIKEVVRNLPATTPAIVISQHLPLAFSESFARHVDLASDMTACIASDGQPINSGTVYIAPGDQHLMVAKSGNHYVCRLNDGPKVNRHKPAVDVMFQSVAKNVGSNAIGILLTGMGADGAKGMKEMHEVGSSTIIQDENTSVVWGMPGEAFKLGCTDHVVPLNRVAETLLGLIG